MVSRNGFDEDLGSVRFGRAVGASGVSSFGAFEATSCFGVGAGGGGVAFGCGAGALGSSLGSTLGFTGCGAGAGSGSGGAILRRTRGSTFTLGGGVTTRGAGGAVSNAPGGNT